VPPGPKNGSVQQQLLRGEVVDIVLFSKFSGRAFVVATFDAAYVVTIDVTWTDDADGPAKIGEQHFVIHSPVQTLHRPGPEAIGHTVSLELRYEKQDGKIRPISLWPS
jgi:hypothetical protein